MRPTTPAALLAAVALLAGCSPSSPEAIEAQGITTARAEDPVVPTGPGGAIEIEAFDLGFQNLTGAAIDGAVEVTLINIGDAEHNFRIDQAAGKVQLVEALGGDTAVGELQLFGAPGGETYTYYCDIPGHRAAGMEGEIIVYLDEEGAADGPLFPGQEMGAEVDAADLADEDSPEAETAEEGSTADEAAGDDDAATEDESAEG